MFLHFVLSLLHLFTHAHYLLVIGFIAPLLFIIFEKLSDKFPDFDSLDDNVFIGAVILFSGLISIVSPICAIAFSYFRLKGEGFHLHAPTGATLVEMALLVIFWICFSIPGMLSRQKEKQVHTLFEKVHNQELAPSFSSKDSASFFQDHCTLRVDRVPSGMKIEIFYKKDSICSFSYTKGLSKIIISNDQIRQYINTHRTFFSSLEKKMWKFNFSFPTTTLTTALNELSSYVAQLDRSKLTLEERLFFQQAFEEELPLIHQTFLLEHEEEVKEVLSFLTEKVKIRAQEQKQTEKESQDSTLQQSIHRIYKKGQEFMK